MAAQDTVFAPEGAIRDTRSPSPCKDDDKDVDDVSRARKRPRLSNAETSPSHGKGDRADISVPTPPSSPFIELVQESPSDRSSGSVESLIVMETKSFPLAILDDFPFRDGTSLSTPERAASALADEFCCATKAIPLEHVRDLTRWLRQCAENADSHRSWVDHKDFWSSIARAIRGLLSRTTLGVKSTLVEAQAHGLFSELFTAYATICASFTKLEAEHLSSAVVRRDSIAPEDGRRHKFLFATSLQSLAVGLSPGCPVWEHLSKRKGFDSRSLRAAAGGKYMTDTKDFEYLLSLFELVLKHSTKIDHSHELLLDCLQLVCFTLDSFAGHSDCRPNTQAFERLSAMFEQAHAVLLPALLRIHPRDVALGLHECTVSMLQETFCCLSHQMQGFAPQHFDTMLSDALRMSHDVDVLSPEASHAQCNALFEDCQRTSPMHLEPAFRLQLAILCLKSPIASHKALGISYSNDVFEKTHHQTTLMLQTNQISVFQHPLTQCLARFARFRNLVGILFGQDSHADIIRRCESSLSFMLLAGQYTNADTDLIWTRLSETNQDEVKHACMSVLISITNIGFTTEQIAYVLSKYQALQMPWNKWCVSWLEEAAKKLIALPPSTDSPGTCIHIATTSTTLFERLMCAEYSVDMPRTHTSLSALFSCSVQALDEVELKGLVEQCSNLTHGGQPSSTGKIQALALLLARRKEAVQLCEAFLSIDPVLDDLQAYNEARRSIPVDPMMSYELIPRIQLALFALAMVKEPQAQAAKQRLWDLVTGTGAANDGCRITGLCAMTQWLQAHESLPGFHDECLREFLPKLPAECATEGLLHFDSSFDNALRKKSGPSTLNVALLGPFVRFALTTPNKINAKQFETAVLQSIFCAPSSIDILAAQIEVTRDCVRNLQYPGENRKRALTLLTQLVRVSSRYEPRTSSKPTAAITDQVVIDECAGADGVLMQVGLFKSPGPPKVMTLRVPRAIAINDLKSVLLRVTECAQLRAFFQGQEIHFDGESPDFAGLDKHICMADTASIQVRVNISAESVIRDPSFATGRTTVETEVLQHFDKVQALLDMDPDVAYEACILLRSIAVPTAQRVAAAEVESSSTKLTPSDNVWKTIYTLHILRCIWSDQLRNGIADEAFLSRSVRLMAELLLRNTTSDQELLHEIIPALRVFLRGKDSWKIFLHVYNYGFPRTIC